MSNEDSVAPPHAKTRIGEQFQRVSPWRKFMLYLSILITGIGGMGLIYGQVSGPVVANTEALPTIESIPASTNSRNLTPEEASENVRLAAQQAHNWFTDNVAPNMFEWGVSFFVAFVLGFAFRTFVKWMAGATAVVLVLVGAMQYFNVVDVLPVVKNSMSDGTAWATQSMTGMKDFVTANLPSSVLGFAGFVAGFLRR